MYPNKDACQKEIANTDKIVRQLNKVIRDFDNKGKLEKLEEPTHPNRARDCTPPRNLINQLDPMECCSAPQIGRQQDPYLKNVMEIAPRETESMHCHYPTEERMVKPLITHNGLTDIRYTTDKNKAIYESGVGVQYKLINVTPEIEAPWCKRNGLQDYWMEDPKYARKGMDNYSTPYPCCKYQSWPYNKKFQPDRSPRKNVVEQQGWDCCVNGSDRRGAQEPQMKYKAGNCEQVARCKKNRHRDIAPVQPREHEFDWKNCNFK
ncbi:hypothetical protein M8J76_008854 [Diaphorina citri]|nr:hypothetical protein M8J76_008854 [Diaphorina citri]